jgi:hypothetical protein
VSTLIDYAMPMMRIEKLLKEMHNSLLENNFTDAQTDTLAVIVEARILYTTLTLMKEQQNALRKQISSVQKRVSAAT